MRSASVQFRMFSPAEARKLLDTTAPTGDTYGDRLAAQRALDRVATPAEVRAARSFKPGKTYRCVGCKRFAFSKPRTRCYWCQHTTANPTTTKTTTDHSSVVTSVSSYGSSSQSSSPSLSLGPRPTFEEMRAYIAATKKTRRTRGAR